MQLAHALKAPVQSKPVQGRSTMPDEIGRFT